MKMNVDQLWVASWVSDVEGRSNYIDPLWSDFTGQTAAQAAGSGWLDAAHPDDREEVLAAWRAAIERRKSFRAEFRLRRADGVYRWVLFVGAPRFDECGAFLGYLGSVIDVDERRAAAAALRESEERFRGLVESYAQAVWEADAEGKLVVDSPSWRAYTGQTREESHGTGWLDALHPEDRAYAERKWRESVETGRPYDVEYRLKKKGGGWRWTNVRGTPIVGPGGAVRKWVGVNIDINARKLAQEALRDSEQRMRLAQDAAHAGSWEWLLNDNRNFWSENLWRLYDLTPGVREASFDLWLSSIHEEDRRSVADAVVDAARAGREFEIQWRVKLPQGAQERWLLSRGQPLVGPSGALERYIGIVFDVTERKKVEEALRQSEERLRAFLEHSATIAWMKDEEGRYTFLSPNYEKRFNVRTDDWKGKTDFDLWPKDVAEAFRRNDRATLDSGAPAEAIESASNPDGSVGWWLSSKFAFHDASGRRYVGGLGVDITERKKAEDALRESERRYRALYETLRDPFVQTNMEGQILAFNELFREMLGYTAEELYALTYQQFTPERWHAFEREIVESQIVVRGYSDVYEKEYRRKDGTVFPIELRVALARDDAGRPTTMSAIVRDITGRKDAELALRDGQQRILLATRAAELGVWEWSVDADEIHWDDQMFRIYGMEPTPGNMVNYAVWASAVLPEDSPRDPALLLRRAREADAHPREFRIRRKDTGENRIIQAVETVRRGGDGRVEWVVGVNRDITELKRAEVELRDADRRKDEFIATLAHELRNPLAPIHNALHILRRNENAATTARQRALLDMMERQIQHLIRLVDELLEISRISRGKIELRKEPTDIGTVLRAALETSEPLLAKARHRTTIRLPSEALRVRADPMRLAQAFTNLVNNAAKYTPPCGRIEIAAERRGDEAIVFVRDNGRGIPPEALPHLFDLFTQVEGRSGRAEGGLGIGLALVRKLIELHGGKVEARSDGPGKGSEFVVRLPLDATPTPAVSIGDPEETALSASARALVIDDDHDVADSLAMLLETFGAAVRVAYSGEAGLQAVEEFRPTLVFLDLGMPAVNGYETAKRIRQESGGQDLTLVALTGWGHEEDRARTRQAGFDAHLTKPASIEALAALLSRRSRLLHS